MSIRPAANGEFEVVNDETGKVVFGPDTYDECVYWIDPSKRPKGPKGPGF
ncbi:MULTISPECIES: hypothetical protein [unclassified Rhizobium]|nr:hypothetical protein [Rhizobium sp. B21/90]MBO9183761.1 hypothetical protein [Rhizobium sp. E27B/91]